MNAPRRIVIEQTKLARLARRLVAADRELSGSYTNADITEVELGILEDRVFDARTALLDHLLNEHGLTKREVDALGGVI